MQERTQILKIVFINYYTNEKFAKGIFGRMKIIDEETNFN